MKTQIGRSWQRKEGRSADQQDNSVKGGLFSGNQAQIKKQHVE